MVDIIAKFNYNNKCYAFGNNNNEIEFYLKDRKNFISDLSEKEISICMQILDSITIDKETSVYLYNKRIGNNIYQIFYDIKTRLHWWNLLYGNKDSKEDNIKLNFLYNNMPDVYYLDAQEDDTEKRNKKDYNYIKLMRVIGTVLISITAISTISFTSFKLKQRYIEYLVKREIYQEIIEQLQDEKIKNIDDLQRILQIDLNNNEDYGSEDRLKRREAESERLRNLLGQQEYNWHSIENAIDSNYNLTQSEKDFFKKLKFVFDEDHQYMNLDMVINNFKTLQITYSNESSDFDWLFTESVGGGYCAELNHIYIKDANSFEDVDLRVFIHEWLHMIQISSTGYSEELAVTIAQREILQRLIDTGEVEIRSEYYDDNGALTNLGLGYPKDHKLLYLTFKLISPKARKQYLYQTDESIIAEELMRIDTSNNNEEKQNRVYKVVDYLNQLKGHDSSKEQQPDELCFKELEYYYNCKYENPIEYDLDAVLAFYDNYDIKFVFEEDEEELVFIPNVNRSYLNKYLDNLSEEDITQAIKKAVFDDNESVEGITITARPANIFFDLDKTATCYWMNDDKTVSKNIDTSVSENYEKEIENRRAENEKWKNR